MTARLPRWLRRAEARWARRPDLEEALLGGRFAALAWVRLRGFLTVRVVASLAHLVEVLLLLGALGRGALVAGLLAVNACQLATAFWWGALEVLRARLRAADGKNARAAELGRWLALAVAGAAVTLALLTAFAGVTGAAGPAFAYVAACALRLAVDLVLRALYSAVYATRRVHRPMLSLVFAEVAALVAVGVAAPALGPYAVALGVVVALVVSRSLTLVYTLRAFRELRWPRVVLRRPGRPREPGRVLLAGLAGVATRLAPAAVVFLLAGGAGRTAVTLHAMAPFLVAASLWPQVFYLDVVRLAPEAAGVLRRRLERRLALLALPVGVLAWVAGLGLAWAARVPASPALAAALAPVFLAQSLLGAQQLASFARGRFAAMAASGVALGVALVAIGPTGALVAAAVVLQLGALLARPAPPARHEALSGWLAELRAVAGPVTASVATLAGATPRQARAVAAALAGRLGSPAAVLAHGARVFWFGELAPAEAAALSAGLISALERHRGETGAAAAALVAGAAPAPLPDVEAAFRARFADGVVIDVARGARPGAGPAWQQALGARRAGEHDVTAWRVRGEIVTLFLVPRAVDPVRRAAWREALARAELHQALQPR